MPPRDNPTARQVRLGAELRKLRERAGKTAREAAGRISTDQARISNIEGRTQRHQRGAHPPTGELLRL
ncbi:helix-turn-helix transcriptional regulator [Streptomyces sp. COG19]|uniref:helix-turn-helix domain-containing protein n=1 Tax=unclassified Streptomyces TaxID=2593676 RepID=UPI0027E5689E|nr:helix-turn-helix transcriptional regulator [Streptomyces sp. COG19]